jgi:hypothetical protein
MPIRNQARTEIRLSDVRLISADHMPHRFMNGHGSESSVVAANGVMGAYQSGVVTLSSIP